jgi:hypothetical protein
MGLADFAQGLQNLAEVQEIISSGFDNALSTMESMVGNEGQQSIFDTVVVEAFRENKTPVKEGWTDVDIGDYMDFMGDLVKEGNDIMAEAYALAEEILSEIEEQAEAFGDDGIFDE